VGEASGRQRKSPGLGWVSGVLIENISLESDQRDQQDR